MAEQLQSLNELARQINVALVRVGRASLRREFNARLWACNRERALAVIDEYREILADMLVSSGYGEPASLFAPLK